MWYGVQLAAILASLREQWVEAARLIGASARFGEELGSDNDEFEGMRLQHALSLLDDS